MPTRGAGIALVDLPISQPIEGHRRGARADHCHNDKEKSARNRQATRRDEHRAQGKWQGKDGMRKPHEVQDPAGPIEASHHGTAHFDSIVPRGSSGSSNMPASRSSTRKSIKRQAFSDL